jgi:MFS family permease
VRSASARSTDISSARGSAPLIPAVPTERSLLWGAIVLAFLAMFFQMGTRVAFAVLYPAIVVERGWSVLDVTGAYSAGLLLYAAIAILAGFGVDRFGCRLMLLSGATLIAVGLIGMALATELWQLYVALMVMIGLGNAGMGFVVLIKLLSLGAGSRFAFAFGLAFTGQGLGSLIVSPAIQEIVDRADWRTATIIYAVLMAIVIIPATWLLAPGPQHDSEGADSATGGLRHDILSRTFALFFLANAGLGATLLIQTHQVAYLLDLGFAATVAAATAGIWGAMTSVGAVGGGWLVGRLGQGRTLVVGFVVFSAGTLTLLFSSPALLALIAVYVVASGLGRGLLGVTLGAAQTQALAGPRLGRLTGVLDVGFGAGAFFGPWLTAVVHDSTGSFGPGFLMTLGMAALVTVGTLVAVRTARR